MIARANSIEDFLIDCFNGTNDIRPLYECEDGELLESNLDQMERVARRLYMQDRDLNPRGIDWSHVFDSTMPDNVRNYFMMDIDQTNPNASTMLKEAASAIMGSQWGKFFDRCITTVFSEIMCRPADFMLGPLFSRIDMPCEENNYRQIRELIVPRIKPVYDIETDLGEMPTMWVNLGGYRTIRMPRLGVQRLGFALNRSLVCLNATEAVSNLLDTTIRENLAWDDELMQYRMLFAADGANDSDGQPTCAYKFWMDDVKYDGYTSDTSLLWTNRYGGPELALTPTNYSALCTLERLWEDARDPHTGRPNACPGDFQILFTSRCEALNYQTLIVGGQQSTMSNLPGDAADTTEFIRPLTARAGWSSSIAYSPYIIDELTDFYTNNNYSYVDIGTGSEVTNLASLTDATEARAQARSTYVLSKSFTDAMGWGVDFDVTTWELSGTNQQIFLDRGITFQRMYEYKRAPIWRRPWLNILVHPYDITT